MLNARRFLAAAAALAAIALAGPAAAWGELGHRAVAELAAERLTPAAKTEIAGLIAAAGRTEPSCPVYSLGDAAAFMGCVSDLGKYGALERLHYDARPFCPPPKPVDYCRNGQCATEALKRAVAVLRDRQQPAPARLAALEQASHLMADLHEPTSMNDNRDDQGERLRVILPGASDKARLSLRDFWENNLPALAVGSLESGLPYLRPVAAKGAAGWARGDIDAWALETHVLAAGKIYPGLPEVPACNRLPKTSEPLDRAYVSAAVPVAREQLAKAGVRLAVVLNDALR